MNVQVNIVNAFSYNEEGGNKAGVVLDADDLSKEQKQEVARKIGLSETAFISRSDLADFKLEFFTPSRQIAHCGHATIASFAFLKEKGRVGNKSATSKETIDGIREIRFLDGEVYMEQKTPIFTYPDQRETKMILDSLGLHMVPNVPPCFVNTGNSFMVLDVGDEVTLRGLEPDYTKITEITQRNNLIGYYVFFKSFGDFDASARMFAPAYGIEEEAATGMAAGPLAAWLYEYGKKKEEYRIAQGYFMKEPSPSRIAVKLQAESALIASMFAGGEATVSEVRSVEVF
ncbi:PhzF family phenazine biosynthesis protein [Desertivirga brevis]|uniref:PhzF family phenazine biosynthesis protein n=1 Tax=Desertivirga brevis TaxID=2810310 RepID=UPI001A971593|nr:PhzF family phenazine biosynthesis protein [Pedobacter sp. SYSU D00873]